MKLKMKIESELIFTQKRNLINFSAAGLIPNCKSYLYQFCIRCIHFVHALMTPIIPHHVMCCHGNMSYKKKVSLLPLSFITFISFLFLINSSWAFFYIWFIARAIYVLSHRPSWAGCSAGDIKFWFDLIIYCAMSHVSSSSHTVTMRNFNRAK